MPSDSLLDLLAIPFDGRVVPNDDDRLNKYSDFNDKPTVLYPWSDKGLCQAIQIKEHLVKRGFVRSGLSSSGGDPMQSEGGLVVDFSCFTRIEPRIGAHDLGDAEERRGGLDHRNEPGRPWCHDGGRPVKSCTFSTYANKTNR